jgi:hypothetical protein
MRTLSFLFGLSMLFSCNHENDNVDNKVIIGNSSSDYAIIKPDPAISITASHSDSLDLNSDGTYEIKFIIKPINTVTGIGSETNIYTRNKLQILLSGVNLPYALSINDVLNNDSIWSDLDSDQHNPDCFKFLLQSYACYSYYHCLDDGNFQNISGKYIGYKLGEKFGWILVDSSTSELKIKEYSVLR